MEIFAKIIQTMSKYLRCHAIVLCKLLTNQNKWESHPVNVPIQFTYFQKCIPGLKKLPRNKGKILDNKLQNFS